MGNILSKYEVHKIALKQRGGSTLGGRKVWFDHDVLRLNYDERGQYLGEFQSDDLILIVQENGPNVRGLWRGSDRRCGARGRISDYQESGR